MDAAASGGERRCARQPPASDFKLTHTPAARRIDSPGGLPYGPALVALSRQAESAIPSLTELREEGLRRRLLPPAEGFVMKVVNSLKTAKKRDKNCRIVRRRGRVYVINKKNPRFKARQG